MWNSGQWSKATRTVQEVRQLHTLTGSQENLARVRLQQLSCWLTIFTADLPPFLLISHAQMFPKIYWCPHFSTSLCWMARVHSHIYIHVHVHCQAGLGGAVSPSPSLLAALHSLCITGCMSRTEWGMNLLNSEYQSMRIWLYKHSDLKDVSDLSIFLQIPSNWCESNPEIWASHKQSAGTNNAAAAELTLWQSVSTSKLFICWEFM